MVQRRALYDGPLGHDGNDGHDVKCGQVVMISRVLRFTIHLGKSCMRAVYGTTITSAVGMSQSPLQLLIIGLADRLPILVPLDPLLHPLAECPPLAAPPHTVVAPAHLLLLAIDNSPDVTLLGIVILEPLERDVAEE